MILWLILLPHDLVMASDGCSAVVMWSCGFVASLGLAWLLWSACRAHTALVVRRSHAHGSSGPHVACARLLWSGTTSLVTLTLTLTLIKTCSRTELVLILWLILWLILLLHDLVMASDASSPVVMWSCGFVASLGPGPR